MLLCGKLPKNAVEIQRDNKRHSICDSPAEPPKKICEGKVKKKPDLLVVLLAVFGLGVVLTLMAPMSSTRSVAGPASALQAGVFTAEESRSD